MPSTASNFITLINSNFPVSGQDNDTEGFRANYNNIKNGLEVLVTDVNTIMLNPVANVTSLNTLTGLNVAGVATITSLNLNGVDISIGNNNAINFANLGTTTLTAATATVQQLLVQTSDNTTATITAANTNLYINGVKNTILYGDTNVTKTVVGFSGTSGPLSIDTITLNSVDDLKYGYAFKLWSTDTSFRSIVSINSGTNQIAIQPIDAAIAEANNLHVGQSIDFNRSSVVARYTGGAPYGAPSSLKGETGDKKGSVFADSSYIYVCTQDYTDGIADIWSHAFLNYYQPVAPATLRGQAGDKMGMYHAETNYIYVCKADYTNGALDIWTRVYLDYYVQPPATNGVYDLRGRSSDLQGMYFADSKFLYICSQNYSTGIDQIWFKSPTVRYASAAPVTNKGQTGDLQGMYFADSSHIYICTADYTDGVASIWARATATTSW